MAKTKGNSIVWLREFIRKHHPDKEKEFYANLNDTEKQMLETALPICWFPVEEVSVIFEKAAKLVYPGDSLGLRKLGRAQAEEQFGGIYSFFIKFISVPKLIEKTARIWHVYHDQGEAELLKSDQSNLLTLTLKEYPEYPDAYGENACGFMEVLLGKTGEKALKVIYRRLSPQLSEWVIEY